MPAGGGTTAPRVAGSSAPGAPEPVAAVAPHPGRLTSEESREAPRIALDAAARPGTASARGGQDTHKGTGGGERNATAEHTGGHARPGEIGDHGSDPYRGPRGTEESTHHDICVTPYRECERPASGSTAPDRATSVDTCPDGERLTDPAAWAGAGFPHVPRDEDQDPMPTHGQGFTIVPRDGTAASQLS